MKTTRERLFKACSIYVKELRLDALAKKRMYPSVKPGTTVIRKYFKTAEFNAKNNKLKITFNQCTFAVKILRYRQVNYVKYPVYSSPYIKSEKDVSEIIELTPSTVEDVLYGNSKVEIRENADLILATIGIIEFFPKSLQKTLIDYIHEANVNALKRDYYDKVMKSKNAVESIEYKLEGTKDKLKKELDTKKKINERIELLVRKQICNAYKSDNTFLYLISFGLISKNRALKRGRKKVNKHVKKRIEISESIFNDIQNANTLEEQYWEEVYKYDKLINEVKFLKAVEQTQYDFDKSNISFPYLENRLIKDPDRLEVKKKTPKLYKSETQKNVEFDEEIEFKKIKDFDIDKYLGLSIKGMFVLKNNNDVYVYVSRDAGIDFEIIKDKIPEEEIVSWKIYFKDSMGEEELEEFYGNLLKEVDLDYL